MDGIIKDVRSDDIAECVNVIRKSFATVAEEFGFTEENAPRFTAFAVTTERLEWHKNHEHRPMKAWWDKGKIAGYYSLSVQEGGECELNNLCVLPGYRHRKIGEKLLMNAFDEARKRGCTKMNISIVEENGLLKRWYEGYGFVHTGTEKLDFFPFTCGYMVKEL